MAMTGKVFPVRTCLRPQPGELLQESRDIAAAHRCSDIFSPPPGGSEVTSQVERDSSIDTKIAPRLTRIAASSGRGAAPCIVASRMVGQQLILKKDQPLSTGP